jgi:hypothetical protein
MTFKAKAHKADWWSKIPYVGTFYWCRNDEQRGLALGLAVFPQTPMRSR